MAQGGGGERKDASRPLVEDAGGTRPFMRGILIHSLMERGVAFEDAEKVANEARRRLRGRRVPRAELAKLVADLCADAGVTTEPPRSQAPSEIAVTGHGQAMPFSKGILSQSLLAAALEPNEAFEVARRIEERLVRERRHRVDRSALRQIASETLEATAGARVARRYRVWRRYQDPERPVILLLGGATGVGKTSLALEVAHRLGIGRVNSTDAIRQVMRLMLSPELVPTIHASSYDAHLVEGFEPTPGADPVVEAFVNQVSVVSVGVKGMLDRAVAEASSLVMDGVALLPGRLDLDAYAGRAHVLFLVIATLDREAFRRRFVRRAEGAVERPEHRYVGNLDAILKIQDTILELAEQHQVPIVENLSFDRSVLSIIRYVTESLAGLEGEGDEAH